MKALSHHFGQHVAAALSLAFSIAAHANDTVHVTRFWHNHQPTYWPDWNSNGPQNQRVQYAWDSIVLKGGQNYGGLSPSYHPENNLTEIFSIQDRVNSYQGGPRNALANLANEAGFALSYSGSLIDGVRQLGSVGQLGYGSGWWDGYRESRNWTTPSGARRMDLVGFTYHHSLAPLLPKPVLRKEIQIFKQAYWKAWGGNPDLSDHSKGFFPTEMGYSRHIIDVLVDEGYEWVIVPSHHISRTCPTYNTKANPEGSFNIFSSPPNKADQIGPSPTSGWWYSEPNPGNAAWNVSPYAYQLQRVKYVNPETGMEKTMVAVPSDDVLSYRFGYANEGIGKIQQFISPYSSDPARPVIVMPATDGDNAWGGGSSSWFEATPQLFNDSHHAGFRRTAPQDFVNAHGAAAQPAHIEDGAWIFPEMCYGSPYFLKWIEPPVANAAIGATNRYPGTQIDMETPGFALKFYSYAPLMAGANWCETAEQILRDEGGSVEAWKIQAPYDWDGTWTNPNEVELAWHIYLHGLDSGFNYYGGLGNDDEMKPGLATRRAVEKLQPWMTTVRRNNDRTPPTVLKPQRFPYNPGGYTFGWFNRIPGGDERFLKKMPSEFYLWTHAYDLSGIPQNGVVAKVRIDADGVNPLASNQNETYAGGPEVGTWVSIPMTRRELPKTREALNAAAANTQIDYFLPTNEVADYYFAKITQDNLPGFRGKLLDYYIEATDTLGNVHKSEIQHVFVENDNGEDNNTPPAAPSVLAATATGDTAILVTWGAADGALDYVIYRDGQEIGVTTSLSWSDSGRSPSTTYTYTVAARNGAGTTLAGESAQVTTPATPPAASGPIPFELDGVADSPGYLLSSPGMTLHAAVRGNLLYVATWAPGEFGNDHFIMVGASLLDAATTAAPWGKAGTTALPVGTPFLAAESASDFVGWFNADGTITQTARASGQQIEGVIRIDQTFGAAPENLYLAALAYQTLDGGLLGAQAPSMRADNGNLDPDELLAVPLAALRDEDANGSYDLLEPGKGFVITGHGKSGDAFSLTWNCFPGRSYRIEAAEAISSASWEHVPGSTMTAGPSQLSATMEIEIDPAAPKLFFRVAMLP